MTITESTFSDNQGVESCIFISIGEDSPISNCYTKISKSTFERNDGYIISVDDRIDPTTLNLEENTFTRNTGQAIMSKNAIVSDSDSIYSFNSAESGAVVTIMRESTYTGTGITFNSNLADTNGGAVFATS